MTASFCYSLIETCRTAEVSYVANFEFNGNNLPQINVSPSISRITVIEQNKIKPKCDTIQNMFKMVKPRSPLTIPDRDYNINNPSPTNFKAVAIREFNKYVPISKCIPEIKAINTKYKNSSTISGDSSNCLRSKENSRVTETMEQCIMDTGHLIGKLFYIIYDCWCLLMLLVLGVALEHNKVFA